MKKIIDWLKSLFDDEPPPTATIWPEKITVPGRLIIDVVPAIDYLVLTAQEAKEIVQSALNTESPVIRFDKAYIAYSELEITMTLAYVPAYPDHAPVVKRMINAGKLTEGNDCDDRARWRKTWLRYALPMCAVFEVSGFTASGSGHRFTGVITNERKVLWFVGTPSHYVEFRNIIM
jgi:hypothetical protein